MMKKLYKYISVLAASFIFVPVFAQTYENNPSYMHLDKWVSGPNNNGVYTLTLEAYATGSSETVITECTGVCDIVMVMDLSSSMTSNNIYVKNSKVTSGTTLTYGNVYIYVNNGIDYYLKGFRSGSKSNYKYTFVYKQDGIPGSSSDGTVLGTAASSSQYSVHANDEIYSTTSKTRLAALQDAAKAFVETIYANNPTNGNHNIGMIGFNESTVLYNSGNLQAATSSNITAMKTWIGNMAKDTGTRSDLGMQEAYKMLSSDAVRNDGNPKTVVFFTDGCPSTSGGTYFNSSYSKAAVNLAYAMKQPLNERINYTVTIPSANSNNSFTGSDYTCTYGLGAYIYSVAILESETSGDNINDSSITFDIRRLLHYVSSNYNIEITGTNYFFGADYNGATCQIEGATGTGSEDPHDYYQLSSGANLTSIFSDIAAKASGSVTEEVPELSSTTSTVIDVVTSDFILPNGASTNITAYSVRIDESATTSENNLRWKTTHAHDGYSVNIDGNKINVSGFDFTVDDTFNTEHTAITSYGNWVGGRTIGNSTTYSGEKLVIEIPIIVNQETYEGGYNTPTNTTESSIVYLNSEGQTDTVAWFPVPKVDFPSIAIAKSGLANGESATFKVERIKDENGVTVSDNIYTVILPESNSNVETFTYNGKVYTYVVIKDVPEGTYKVTESNWSWTYDPVSGTVKTYSCAVPEHLGTGDGPVWTIHDSDGEDRQVIAFIFDDAPKTGAIPAHGEDSVVNRMYVY